MMSSDVSDMACALGLLFVLGVALLFLRSFLTEGFLGGPQRCGVNQPCDGHLKCINGFCAATDPVPMHERNPVPLLPPGGPAPYF